MGEGVGSVCPRMERESAPRAGAGERGSGTGRGGLWAAVLAARQAAWAGPKRSVTLSNYSKKFK
jgi:hypothetical protein